MICIVNHVSKQAISTHNFLKTLLSQDFLINEVWDITNLGMLYIMQEIP